MSNKKLLPIKTPVKMGFLAFLADQGGCGILRTITPYLLLNHLNIPGVTIHTTYFSQYIGDYKFYKNFSFIQFQRSATEQHLKIHRDFRHNVQTMHKVPLIYEIDDLLFDIPKWNFAHEYYKSNKNNIEAMMSESNAIVVSTNVLKNVYKKYNKNIDIVPNHLAKFIWGDIKPKHERFKDGDKVRILWAGSQNHFRHKMMKSAPDGGDFGDKLLDFIRKTVDVYQWVMMGAMPIELEDLKDKIEFHKWKNTWEYPHYMLSLNADIGIAPLVKGLFNDSKCVVGNTLMPTIEGIKTIRDVYTNKYNRISQHIQILNYFKYEKQKTIKITTENGYQLEGAYTHKIRDKNDSWKMLRELEVNDEIKIYPFDILQNEYQHMTFPMLLTKKIEEDIYLKSDENMLPRIVINEGWGRLLGYLIGDGYFNCGNRVSISCDKRYPDIIEDVHSLFNRIGLRTFEVVKINGHSEDKHITNPNGVDIVASSRNLRLLLEKVGFTGRYGKVLEIPRLILDSPKSVIREFLRGLFEADGTAIFNSSCCSLSTKSEKLARQVHFILLGFGIKCRVGKNLNKKYQKYYWTVYLGREATDLFNERIGFVSKRKNDKLKNISLKEHSNKFKKDDWLEKIVKIDLREDDVFDIEVDNHEYNANGFCNHNSNIKALEYTAAGIPGVYGDVSPYSNLTTKCETEEYMIDKIESFASNIDLRQSVFEKDYNILKDQLWWEENDNLKKYINTYLKLMNRKLPN